MMTTQSIASIIEGYSSWALDYEESCVLADLLEENGITVDRTRSVAGYGLTWRMRRVVFFWQEAGYSYHPTTETREQGRARCAAELTSALEWALCEGVSAEWQGDQDAWDDHDEDDTVTERYESCIVRHPDGRTTSLSAIGDPTHEYRRVVEAELYDELRKQAPREVDHDDDDDSDV
jgi:hypothetical protein